MKNNLILIIRMKLFYIFKFGPFVLFQAERYPDIWQWFTEFADVELQ